MEEDLTKKRKVFYTLVAYPTGITAEAIAKVTDVNLNTVKTYLEEFVRASLHISKISVNGTISYKYDGMGYEADKVYETVKSSVYDLRKGVEKKKEVTKKKDPGLVFLPLEEKPDPLPSKRLGKETTTQQQNVDLIIKIRIQVQVEQI